LGHHALISTAQEKNFWGALGCQNRKTDFGIPWVFNLDTCPNFFRIGHLHKILRKKLFSAVPLSKLGALTVGNYGGIDLED